MNFAPFDLERLYKEDFFSDPDYFFAVSLAKIFNVHDPITKASLALSSMFLGLGHICVDLKELAGNYFINENNTQSVKFPEEKAWISALQKSSLVSGDIHTPLVLDTFNKLYLARYFDFQKRLITNIAGRLKSDIAPMDMDFADKILKEYFPEESGKSEHYKAQKFAVRNAVSKPFTIISGGPGTGKTFIIHVIRQIMDEYAKKMGRSNPHILCLAPTGKAASRIERGKTIHSALKPLKDGQKFYHNKNNPLYYDLVTIDEASMIDLPLFVHMLEAIPDTTRVILTGDAHQLSAVQAGAVFSDLCKTKALSPYRFQLKYNFRSIGKSGIEKLSQAIKESSVQSMENILLSDKYPDIQFIAINEDNSLKDILTEIIPTGYSSLLNDESIDHALLNTDRFRVLCAHNKGPYGTGQINSICENILQSCKNFDIQNKKILKLIMIKVNNYKKELFNGDTGIVVEQNNERMAFFKKADNQVQSFRYSDLPSHEPAFAITIHKSQGSEFDTVLIIIPDKFSPIVTKELLYTGVTRAKKKVILVGNPEIIKNAIKLEVKRYSGIAEYIEKIPVRL